MIKDMISELKAQQACAVKMMKEVDEKVAIVSKECDKILNEEFNKVFPGLECRMYTNLSGGSHALEWQPSIYFTYISGRYKTKYGWIVKNYNIGPGLFKNELNIVEPPVDENKLNAYFNAMTDKLGIKVYLCIEPVSDQYRPPKEEQEDDY